jgi:hypothetical protein
MHHIKRYFDYDPSRSEVEMSVVLGHSEKKTSSTVTTWSYLDKVKLQSYSRGRVLNIPFIFVLDYSLLLFCC